MTTVATFNVNSVKARLAFVMHWLEARAPDIACLQELKLDDDKFPFDDFERAGYHAAVHGQPQWNGVAVLSRKPLTVVHRGLPGAEDQGARLITVDVDGLEVTSVYVPNGKTVSHEDYGRKLVFLERLSDYLAERMAAGSPMVVGGDFNLGHRDLDSHDPQRLAGHIFHTEAERRALDVLLGHGLHDLYRETEPEGTMFSWWDYRAGAFHKGHGLRIDLLLGDASVRARTEGVHIDRDYRKKKDGQTPSDHAPVTATLRDA
ncbi:MAG: exodeoxyribonuclease III [Myxococcota bacterium]